MELHTKQLQIGMNRAVAAQLFPPKCFQGPPNGDFLKKISKALMY